MKAIVRKRQRRRLVETDKGELVFKLRGSLVQPHKIDRWMKKNGIMQNTAYSPSPTACKWTFHFASFMVLILSFADTDSNPLSAQRIDAF
jgi:hypothetical protein